MMMRVDVVFSNWLYMYLDDAECLTLFEKIFGWLREGGHLFLRESCYKPSGDVKRNSNPTFYRSPSDYYNMLKKVRCQSDAEEYFLFVEKVVNVRAYIKIHFEVLDATRATFEEGSFDVIYSRDTLLHIADKHTLFSRFY
ncbi:phosphoethanolamine N-methyltransferase, putative, partial [Ixodes scapularis]